MANIIEVMKGFITPDLVSNASSNLGETMGGIKNALSAAFPSILGGMLNRSTETSSMSKVLDMAKQQDNEVDILSEPSRLSSGLSPIGGSLLERGKNFIGSLFGDRTNDVVNAIGNSSGVKSSSAFNILSMAVPMLMGYIGRKANTGGWNIGNFTNYLHGQSQNIQKALPAGLSNIIGGDLFRKKVERERMVSTREREPVRKKSGISPLLVGVLALLMLFFVGRAFSRHAKHKRAEKARKEMMITKPTTKPIPTNPVEKEPIEKPSTYSKLTLPNGVTLNAPPNGVESKFISFIQDKSKPISKTTWFTLDRLTFENKSAKLQSSSQEQLKNIAEILKAYPNVKIKLGGYTDNIGDPVANMKLSAERAKNVKMEMEKLGASSSQITSEGYGEKHPVASNDTDAGRAQNRRIDINVTSK